MVGPNSYLHCLTFKKYNVCTAHLDSFGDRLTFKSNLARWYISMLSLLSLRRPWQVLYVLSLNLEPHPFLPQLLFKLTTTYRYFEMATITTDGWIIEAHRRYWVPTECYSDRRAWYDGIQAGNFAAWSRPVSSGSASSGSEAGQMRPMSYGAIPTMAVTDNRAKITVPKRLARDVPFLGHRPGDFVFRLDYSMAHRQGLEVCLKYEGQIPRENIQHLYQLKTGVLPDILEMVISLLAYQPLQPTRPISAELQRVRDKHGDVDQTDLDLLLSIWQTKYTTWATEGGEARLRPANLIEDLNTDSVMCKYAEAAWIIHRLQRSGVELAFKWHSLIELIELASDCALNTLLTKYDEHMRDEALKLLRSKDGHSGQVLVYCLDASDDIQEVESGRSNQTTAAQARRLATTAQAPVQGGSSVGDPGSWVQSVLRRLAYQDPLSGSAFHEFYRDVDRAGTSNSIHYSGSPGEADDEDPPSYSPYSPSRSPPRSPAYQSAPRSPPRNRHSKGNN
ncbi:hypothetical protein B0T25DRAFT_607348 [Lasiosphaeria hispida]|uniref:Uncharacterized protein n=1 Tax=Lasiosphaeria hispida TaxID=260671 RepID=A0AAJ0ME79_9PEZI|nr:hypothetical protein B0T25DRAFT_607348 [Lasiosphaeria hispida]